MLKYIRFSFPFIVVLMCIVGMIANHFNGISSAVDGYFIAAIGWITISVDELVRFLNERKKN